jgi:2'-5' RNA ligase
MLPMQLRAALVPPPPLADAVTGVVASVSVPVEEPAPVAAPSHRGLLRRRAPATVELDAPVGPPPPQLDLVLSDQMHLPLCAFGNVTTDEQERLRRALAQVASGLPSATVWVAGGTALEFSGDRSVWAKLEGDIDALWAIFRGINEGVEKVGFFLDRRSFRPLLAVGTINDATTAPYLEDVVAALDAFRSDPWQVEAVSLMKVALTGKPPRATELGRVPLGG